MALLGLMGLWLAKDCLSGGFVLFSHCFHALLYQCHQILSYFIIALLYKEADLLDVSGCDLHGVDSVCGHAFPPVLDVGTYSFIREEDQCTFQHRSFRANDSLGFMLLLALILLATQLEFSLKLIFFVHDSKEMKPVQLCSSQPELDFSWSWSQWPGSCQLASRIWKGSHTTHLAGHPGKMQTPRAEEGYWS